MSGTVNPDGITPAEGTRMSRHFGLVMAIASTALGVIYLLGLGLNLATSGAPYPSGADVRTISAGIALVWNVVLLILFASLRREAEPSKRYLAELG